MVISLDPFSLKWIPVPDVVISLAIDLCVYPFEGLSFLSIAWIPERILICFQMELNCAGSRFDLSGYDLEWSWICANTTILGSSDLALLCSFFFCAMPINYKIRWSTFCNCNTNRTRVSLIFRPKAYVSPLLNVGFPWRFLPYSLWLVVHVGNRNGIFVFHSKRLWSASSGIIKLLSSFTSTCKCTAILNSVLFWNF